MILTQDQIIHGVPRKTGDAVFMDPGGLTTDKNKWQTPEDLVESLNFYKNQANPRGKKGVDEIRFASYTQNKGPMKRQTPKKSDPQNKSHPHKTKGGQDPHPLEFDRGWQELEAQHDRIKSDWMSLAAQMGIGLRSRHGSDF